MQNANIRLILAFYKKRSDHAKRNEWVTRFNENGVFTKCFTFDNDGNSECIKFKQRQAEEIFGQISCNSQKKSGKYKVRPNSILVFQLRDI